MQLSAPDRPMPEDAPGLRVGQKAPDFQAVTASGKTVKLSELTAKGPVVLIFYRGAWCPFCNLHLQSFQAQLDKFRQAGATVLAVSVDKPDYAAQTVQKGGLDFEVVSDNSTDILRSYGLVFEVPAPLAEKYRTEYGIDLEAHSGRTDHVIAIPATYIVDSGGTIVFAYANIDYKVRVTPEQVLEVLARYNELQS